MKIFRYIKQLQEQSKRISELETKIKAKESRITNLEKILNEQDIRILYYTSATAQTIEARKAVLQKWYFGTTGNVLNLDQPKTFNEKIQYLKLYNTTKEKATLSDKYAVRDYVAQKIGTEYLIDLIGVYDNFEAINFSKLPSKFALKATHGSGYNLIVKDKKNLDLDHVRQQVNSWLSENFAYRNGLELHYAIIQPRLIIEQFCNCELELQFWCFNGKPRFISAIKSPHGENEKLTYNMQWQKLDFVTSLPRMKHDIPKPPYLDEAKKCAKSLCQDFKFVRVDFIHDGHKLLFSEMTFTPASGACKWDPASQDLACGKMLKIK